MAVTVPDPGGQMRLSLRTWLTIGLAVFYAVAVTYCVENESPERKELDRARMQELSDRAVLRDEDKRLQKIYRDDAATRAEIERLIGEENQRQQAIERARAREREEAQKANGRL